MDTAGGGRAYGFEVTGVGRKFANPNGTAPDGVNGFGGAGGGIGLPGTSFTPVLPLDLSLGVYQVRVIGLGPDGFIVGSFSDAIDVVGK